MFHDVTRITSSLCFMTSPASVTCMCDVLSLDIYLWIKRTCFHLADGFQIADSPVESDEVAGMCGLGEGLGSYMSEE